MEHALIPEPHSSTREKRENFGETPGFGFSPAIRWPRPGKVGWLIVLPSRDAQSKPYQHMFVLNNTIVDRVVSAEPQPSGGHRHYRGRNSLEAGVLEWGSPAAIPDDVPDWGDLCARSARAGGAAARQSLKPAVLVWAAMACIAVLYYAVPATQGFFSALNTLQENMGLVFPFLGMGLSVGILAEGVKVAMSKEKRWTKANTVNATFNLLMFGVLGVLQKYLYALQAQMFGEGSSPAVLVPKVLFDQFIWTVFFANPYQAILYLWKNSGFSWKKVLGIMLPFKAFWGTQVLPVLITNWAFWIPMVSIIYCFPAELQLPLAILAATIWVLLLSILTSSKDEA